MSGGDTKRRRGGMSRYLNGGDTKRRRGGMSRYLNGGENARSCVDRRARAKTWSRSADGPANNFCAWTIASSSPSRPP
jgi:hypothetical protein